MKILILGSTGMLGNAVVKELKNSKYQIYYTHRNNSVKLDNNSIFYDPLINDFELLKNYNFIINCIGVIKPFVREENSINSIYLNSIFPRNLSNFCESNNIKLLQITTDCVFSGKDGLYTENSLHDCTDIYGKTKSLGESKNCMFIRTSIIGDEIHKNASLISWLKSNSKKEVNGYINHFWNGITTRQYGKICLNIINKDLYSNDLYHVYSEDVSKYELLKLINKHYKLDIKINQYRDNESIDRRLRTVKNLNSILKLPTLEQQIIDISSLRIK